MRRGVAPGGLGRLRGYPRRAVTARFSHVAGARHEGARQVPGHRPPTSPPVTDFADCALRWIPAGPGAPLECLEIVCTACDVRVRVGVHALELANDDGVRSAAERAARGQFARVHGRCPARRT